MCDGFFGTHQTALKSSRALAIRVLRFGILEAACNKMRLNPVKKPVFSTGSKQMILSFECREIRMESTDIFCTAFANFAVLVTLEVEKTGYAYFSSRTLCTYLLLYQNWNMQGGSLGYTSVHLAQRWFTLASLETIRYMQASGRS